MRKPDQKNGRNETAVSPLVFRLFMGEDGVRAVSGFGIDPFRAREHNYVCTCTAVVGPI